MRGRWWGLQYTAHPDYLRTAALNDETTITLEEGAAIARLLVEMQKNLNHMCAKGVVSWTAGIY